MRQIERTLQRTLCKLHGRTLLVLALLLALGGCASMSERDQPPAPAGSAAETPAPEEQREPGSGKIANTLKWSTASEVDNFGFDIYRAESEDGPFERVNPEPIAGRGTTDDPTFYQYVDDTIEPGKAYFYYIESISLSNEREKFTPTFRSKPKYPSDDAEAQD